MWGATVDTIVSSNSWGIRCGQSKALLVATVLLGEVNTRVPLPRARYPSLAGKRAASVLERDAGLQYLAMQWSRLRNVFATS